MTKRVKYNLTGLIGTVLLVALDQWTKLLAVRHLMGQAAVPILDGVFELHYLENRGAAFGILQGQKGIFLLCTALVLVVLAFYYNRMPVTGRFRLLRLVGVLLSAGAVGNLIDRMQHSYVVDFLYFKLIDFPIFNVADCYVTVGAVLLAAAILFVYKEDELGFLSLRKPHE
ncbi:signal peptidase II [Anaerosacchariphilus sp. NSJ-68]|uniref:Lipoprotein signal peptidase n=2 Tax=Lachnospiraceae TaxID=186803 RepID=A0A923LCX0_9FIRM|nr:MULTISPECIES: signal peptidase II [Lachnospiraceae]MBC5660199.1 signal peptidase II [Anaerosacchariphilus hominis]MBC5699314.1 signal peptidase II [Roseburia difficilis]